MQVQPTEHARRSCFHPRYHPEEPNYKGMELVRGWVFAAGWAPMSADGMSFVRVAQLCEFGGAMWHDMATDTEEASGTFYACPECSDVGMCGFNDRTGIDPKRCPKCGAVLSAANYFQPIYRKGASCRVRTGYCLEHHRVHNRHELMRIARAMAAVIDRHGPQGIKDSAEYLGKQAGMECYASYALESAVREIVNSNLFGFGFRFNSEWCVARDKTSARQK